MNNIYNHVTEAILKPLSQHYADPAVVEVRMSAPCEITVERRDVADKVHLEDENLSVATLKHINTCLSNKHGLSFDPSRNPQISCVLPGGHRYECMLGPSVQSGVSLAIRCKHAYAVEPAMFGLDQDLIKLLYKAVAEGKNIVISGDTNSGKTTFLNLLVQTLPPDTRIVCAEDTPEIDYSKFQHDSAGLIAARGDDVPGMNNWSGISDHMNRITPDRLIYGEISTRNVQAAIAAMNCGVQGVMCTIHASSPSLAFEKFGQNLALDGKPIDHVTSILRNVVDLVIQIKRLSGGVRQVIAVYDVKADTYLFQSEHAR